MQNIRIERAYHENGQLQWEGSFNEDKLEGPNRQWHDNGVLSSETFFEGNLEHGIARQWDRNGKLLGEYRMNHGTGISKKWYENGQLERENSEVCGKWCGRFRCWFEDGEVIATNYYIANSKVSKKKYIEACKKDPTLPRYEDNESDPEEPEIIGSYQKRKTPASELERHRHTEFINKFLRKPNRGEARQWLKGDENRWIGEMSHEDSVEFVEDGYKAGATKIIAVDIDDETTDRLIVYPPSAGTKREQVFMWNNKHAQEMGFDPDEDWGQNELFIYFD
jgi:hypothetical protein